MTFGVPYTAWGSRLSVLIAGVTTVALSAFIFAVAVVATVLTASRSGELDPAAAAELATPVGLVAAGMSSAGVLLARRALWLSRVRSWLPLYEAMVCDASRIPGTSLVEIRHRPWARSTGSVLAVDIDTGWQRLLRLPASARGRGTVVCLAETLGQPVPLTWMSGTLWHACRRETTRAAGKGASLRRARGHLRAGERRFRRAANEAVTAAEEILRQHSR